MSVDYITHRCTCQIIDNLIVDGDTDAVYHDACSGLVGWIDEMPLERLAHPTYKYVKGEAMDEDEIRDSEL